MAKSEKIIISVELTDKGLKASSSKAKKAIDGVTESTSKLEKATKDLAFQQTKEAEELAKMQLKAQLATKANKELAVSTLSAASAAKQGRTQNGLNNAILTETGRMASDAAYGMRGMANNLGQLMSLMNQHAQTRGGFIASFKELGRSLMGTGGVLIALQLLISFAPEIEKFFRSLMKESKKTADAVMDTSKALSSLDSEAQSSVGHLIGLISVVKDINIAEEERLKAIKELNEEYPDFNTNILNERDNYKLVSKEITKYIDELIRMAKVKALEEEIGKKALAAAKAEESLRKNRGTLTDKEIEDTKKIIDLVEKEEEIKNKLGSREYAYGITLFRANKARKEAIKLSEELAPLLRFDDGKKPKGDPIVERVVKAYKEGTLKLGQILLKWQNQLKKTTKRNEQEIIRDTGENSKEIIRIKRTEFEDIEKERLKFYIAKQEALVKGKKITRKDADIAIGIAKERSEASINKANEEADGVIEAIDRVTEARIANQIKIEELNALKRGSKEEESSASNTVDMMPEGMEKIEAEKALSDLRYNNKVAAAEAELEMLAENSDKKKDLLSQMSIWEDERRVVDLQNEIDVVNEKQRVNEEYMGFLSGISGVLSTLAGESELIRKTALVLEKGAAIASVIGQTNAANANIASQSSDAAVNVASKGWAATDVGAMMMASGNIVQGKAMMAAGTKGIATGAKITAGAKAAMGRNRIGAGIAIAGILAESVVGLDSGGRGGSSSGGGGGQTVQPPDFNIIGSTGTNQLAEAIGTTTKLPIKAYVVSSDVTSAQEMDRNIVESSSIG